MTGRALHSKHRKSNLKSRKEEGEGIVHTETAFAKVKMKRVQVTFEMDVPDDKQYRVGAPLEELQQGIRLPNGWRLVSKEVMYGPFVGDAMQTVRDAVRSDIQINGESCYGLSMEEVTQLTEEMHPHVEQITRAAYDRVCNGNRSIDEAVEMETDRFFAEKMND